MAGLGPNPLAERLGRGRLSWWPEVGVGYFECESAGAVYDQAYFDRYAEQAAAPLGRALMAARVELVRRTLVEAYGAAGFMDLEMLDVGVGSGAYLEAAAAAGARRQRGFDVNPAGIAWLRARRAWGDLYRGGWAVATFWDALEHIRDPRPALAAVDGWAFVAIPVFRDAAHVLASRHYRRDEHYWYWTRAGFRGFAEAEGFEVVDITATETALGRDEVETFVLRRRR